MTLVQCISPYGGTAAEGNPDNIFFMPVSPSVKRTGEDYSWRANAITTGTRSAEFLTQNTQPTYNNVNTANATYRFYFNAATLPASLSEEICQIRDTSDALKLALRIKSDGKIQVYNSGGTTQLGSDSTVVLSADTWYRIEIQCGTGAAATYTVRIYDDNDSPTLLDTLTGTGNLSTTNHRGIRIGKVTNRNGQTVDFYYTGLHIRNDLTWCGHSRYKILVPVNNGTDTGWAGVYTAVDEPPPHDGNATAINAVAVAATETYVMQNTSDVGLSTETINALRIDCRAKSTSGSPSCSVRVRSGGSAYDSSAATVTANVNGTPDSYTAFAHVRELDPATSALWTHSGVDSMEAGIHKPSSTGSAVCTAVWVMVDYVPSASPPPTASGNFFQFF